MKILVTGSSGFLGKLLLEEFDRTGISYVGADLNQTNPIDVCNPVEVESLFTQNHFDTVIHLASKIDFASSSQKELYDNNVKSTEVLCQAALKFGVRKFIFTSSNSVYLGNSETIGIHEGISPQPIDMYGRSKVDSEQILNKYAQSMNVVNLRCPNIIDAGRVGMLSILFELLQSNSALWTIGDGSIRHQCIYAKDLISVFYKVLKYEKSNTFNLGSERVPTFYEMYQALIELCHSRSKIRSIPGFLAIFPLKLLYRMGLSPMGPYQFRMLTRDFVFDISRAKQELDWKPTLNNTEMLGLAYEYFVKNKEELKSGKISANSAPVKMGVLRLLKVFR